MKISAKKLFVFFAILLTFTAVQAAWADELTVTGPIDRVGGSSIDVVADGTTIYTFYDIPLTALATAGIVLAVGDVVTISAYVVTFRNGMVKNIAYSITKGDVTYAWHPNVPKVGATGSITPTSEYADSNCPGCEPAPNNYDYNYDNNYKYLTPGPHKK